MRGLVALAVLAAAAVFPVAATPASPPVCKVPKLVGATTASARSALKRAGCPAGALTVSALCAAKAKSGRILDQKPAAKAALKRGQKVVVHVGKYCPPPPPPPPPGPPPPAPPPPPSPGGFAGGYSGTYTGTVAGGFGCPDFAVSGVVLVAVTQIGTSYDVQILLRNADVVTTEMCVEVDRSDSEGEVIATASGNTLVADGLTATLSGTTLEGTIKTPTAHIDFTVSRY